MFALKRSSTIRQRVLVPIAYNVSFVHIIHCRTWVGRR